MHVYPSRQRCSVSCYSHCDLTENLASACQSGHLRRTVLNVVQDASSGSDLGDKKKTVRVTDKRTRNSQKPGSRPGTNKKAGLRVCWKGCSLQVSEPVCLYLCVYLCTYLRAYLCASLFALPPSSPRLPTNLTPPSVHRPALQPASLLPRALCH